MGTLIAVHDFTGTFEHKYSIVQKMKMAEIWKVGFSHGRVSVTVSPMISVNAQRIYDDLLLCSHTIEMNRHEAKVIH